MSPGEAYLQGVKDGQRDAVAWLRGRAVGESEPNRRRVLLAVAEQLAQFTRDSAPDLAAAPHSAGAVEVCSDECVAVHPEHAETRGEDCG